MKWLFRQNRFIFLLGCAPVLFFFSSLFTYFAQDDFFLLSVSKAANLNNLFEFFIPRPDVVWYRPLSSQVFFFTARLLFGLQPFFYHLIVFVTHATVIIFLYKLLLRFGLNNKLSFVSALAYGIHQIHVVSLSWLATYSFVLGPLFLVLLLYYSNLFRYKQSLLVYFAGMLTTEFFIVFMPLYTWNEFIYTGKINKIKSFSFAAVSAFILYLRFVAFPTQFSSDLYKFALANEIFPTLKFYLFRIFGIPLLYDILPLILQLVSFISVILCVGFVLVGIYQSYTSKLTIPKWVWLTGGTSLVSLFPFMLLTSHVAPHYLSFTLITLLPIFSWFISRARLINVRVWTIVFMAFLFSNTIGIIWTYQTHWIFRRAKLAEKLVQQQNFIHPVGSEEYVSLGANSAAQDFGSKP